MHNLNLKRPEIYTQNNLRQIAFTLNAPEFTEIISSIYFRITTIEFRELVQNLLEPINFSIENLICYSP